MHNLFKTLVWLCLFFACSQANDKKEKDHQHSNKIKSTSQLYALTEIQQSAFDALNLIQVSTDENNRLYSTFAGIVQACYPPDTILKISQAELLLAMNQFVISNCKTLQIEERLELASSSVQAQEEYVLALCVDSTTPRSYSDGVPRNGTWILQNVLGHRDVIIVW